MCCAGLWAEAHTARESLLGYLTRASGVGTLLDTRRARDYDPDLAVDRYLNQPAVQARVTRTALDRFRVRVLALNINPIDLASQTVPDAPNVESAVLLRITTLRARSPRSEQCPAVRIWIPVHAQRAPLPTCDTALCMHAQR